VPRTKNEPTGDTGEKSEPTKKRTAKKRTAKAPSAGKRKAKVEAAPEQEMGEAEEHEGEGEREDESDGEVIEVVGEVVEDEGELDASKIELPKARGKSSTEMALSRSDPLQAYLREVQRHPLLTPEEEQQLTRQYHTNPDDVRTAARLVTSNLRLVVKLAYEYRRAYKNIMDLIQEGNIGLMQAVKRYDPYRGVKLSSYAAWWIRAYMLRYILNNWRLVKLGTTQAQRKLFFNLSKEKARLSAMGIEPTAAEIARRLSVEEKEVVDMDRRMSSSEASLDAPAGDAEGRPIARIELMPSSGLDTETTFERLEIGALVHDKLESFRETLSGKDVIIFDKRMTADEPLTLQELGNEFGISRERVRQLEARLAAKLREYLQDELGEALGTE